MFRGINAQLLAWKQRKDRKPLILLGARQVGKTFSLQEFGKQAFRQVHYLNFENQASLAGSFNGSLSPHKILEQLSLTLGQSIDPAHDLLILDEIQVAPLALTSLKYFAEELPQMAVTAAGSLLGLTLQGGSFPVGKVDFLHLFPLHFGEFLMALGRTDLADFLSHTPLENLVISEALHEELWHLFKIYTCVGGLPEAIKTYLDHKQDLLTALTQVSIKQEDLLRTYWADIAKHSGKPNALHIRRVMENIPAQLVREVDGGTKRFTFKGVVPGVSRYEKLVGPIDWLEAAGLIFRCHIVDRGEVPFAAYQKENRFKLYFFDTGLLAKLSELSPQSILLADYGTFKGFFAENFVAQELTAHGQRKLYAWNEGTSELEFLLTTAQGKPFPLEVKAGQNIKAKSLKIFCEKYHPPQQMLLSALPPKEAKVSRDAKGFESKKYYWPLYLTRRVRELC